MYIAFAKIRGNFNRIIQAALIFEHLLYKHVHEYMKYMETNVEMSPLINQEVDFLWKVIACIFTGEVEN